MIDCRLLTLNTFFVFVYLTYISNGYRSTIVLSVVMLWYFLIYKYNVVTQIIHFICLQCLTIIYLPQNHYRALMKLNRRWDTNISWRLQHPCHNFKYAMQEFLLSISCCISHFFNSHNILNNICLIFHRFFILFYFNSVE